MLDEALAICNHRMAVFDNNTTFSSQTITLMSPPRERLREGERKVPRESKKANDRNAD